MLPFDQKPWAKNLARVVIVASLLLAAAFALYLRQFGPLDTPEILICVLFLVATIPPNIAIIRRKPGTERARDATARPIRPHV